MALIRFRPVTGPSRDLVDIQAHMDRLFDSFLGQPTSPPVMDGVWAPAVDMYETKSEVVISAEIPGLDEKDIHLSITDDLLSIQGERQWTDNVKDARHYRRERWFGKFERTLALPMPVETGQVKATYREGVLTVKLPKAEEIKPKEIKIDAV